MTELNPSEMPGGTAQELKARAAAHARAAGDSFERSDTDGALTQWAHGVNGERDLLASEIAENGGYHRFPALFDRNGALVHAREIETRHGWRWLITDPRDPNGPGQWFRESGAKDWRKRLAFNASKGYFVGSVLLPAVAVTRGSGTGLSGACSVRAVAVPANGPGDYTDYVILDNGSASVPAETIRAEYVRTISRHEERTDPDGVTARVINEQLARVDLWARADYVNGR